MPNLADIPQLYILQVPNYTFNEFEYRLPIYRSNAHYLQFVIKQFVTRKHFALTSHSSIRALYTFEENGNRRRLFKSANSSSGWS